MKRPFSGKVAYRNWGSDPATFKEIVTEQVYSCVLPYLNRQCSYIVDLGAHVGLATRYFAEQCPGATVCAVEASPENYELLKFNVAELVAQGRCHPSNYAVWGKDELLHFAEAGREARFSSLKVVSENASASAVVPGRTLIGILEEVKFPRIDLLKVDIEGAEVELFSGNVEWLEKTSVIAIEFHGNTRVESQFDDLIKSYGFMIAEGNRHTTLAIRKGDIR